MKIFLLRTTNGIKKGLFTPTLSKEMLEFQRKPLIRILRVLGGISWFSLFGYGYFKLNGVVLYISLFFVINFLIYHIYISIHRFKHIKKILMSDELEVKNSPLDKYATLLARIVLCAKGSCEYATPVGVGLGLMLGADQVLKDSGREAFFSPLIGAGINKVYPKGPLAEWKDSYYTTITDLISVTKEQETLMDLINKTDGFKDLRNEDRSEFIAALKEIKITNEEDLKIVKSRVAEILENKPTNK